MSGPIYCNRQHSLVHCVNLCISRLILTHQIKPCNPEIRLIATHWPQSPRGREKSTIKKVNKADIHNPYRRPFFFQFVPFLLIQEWYELKKLLKEYYMLFPKDEEKLSHVSQIRHKINTTDDIPIYSRQYLYPYVYKKEIDSQVEDLLKRDKIKETNSPWSSPV